MSINFSSIFINQNNMETYHHRNRHVLEAKIRGYVASTNSHWPRVVDMYSQLTLEESRPL